jgi:hypothetical protein
LAGDEYQRIGADAAGALVSEELGLRLQAEHGTLGFYRLDRGQRLLTAREACEVAEAARQAAEAALREEAAARQAAEAEVARLREELRRRTSGQK